MSGASTLSVRILDLTKLCPTLSSAEIGAQLGCNSSYVRTVWHRAGMFRGPHDSSVFYDSPPKYVRGPFAEYEKLLAAAARGGAS